MSPAPKIIIDIHSHVGVIGEGEWAKWGSLSPDYRRKLEYKIFLLYADIPFHEANDQKLFDRTVEVLNECQVDHVVCLALDPVFDAEGVEHKERSDVWVSNEYILHLHDIVGDKVLFGASVHPYDRNFKERVLHYVNEGAVLLKWLPSAQQFDLADPMVLDAMKFLATAKKGKPLPLLLHTGMEYAISTTDPRTQSYDFHSWSWMESAANFFRGKKRWFTPKVNEIAANIRKALDAGTIIIFAHLGLPYFASGAVGKYFEHSDFEIVKQYLRSNGKYKGRCYADVSALCTPFRQTYFQEVMNLPAEYLLFGSDFPTPAFELSADINENLRDLKDILNGHLERIIIPQGNLIDVNLRELQNAFLPSHPMFTNFSALMD